MPSWLVTIIINYILPLAVKLGIPMLLKKFPNLPPEIQQIIEDLIKHLTDPVKPAEEKKVAKREAARKLKQLRSLQGASDIVKE